jgi:transposase-like protein
MNDKITISTAELFRMFLDQESARKYLESRLWPNGPRCPVCGMGDRITTRAGGYYRCNQCVETFTARTGTIFERSHVPLHKWLHAMYLFLTARKGISGTQLSKELRITQKTARFVLQRLREACGSKLESKRDHLQGVDRVNTPKPPPEFDALADVVLAFRPKPKSKPAKKRARRQKKIQRK